MTHSDLSIILGPPGTGKTYSLLGIMQTEMARGVRPDRIAVLTFTRKAALEAMERACQQFGYQPGELPYCRTIHSLCFRQTGLKPDRVMQPVHYRTLGVSLGIELRPRKAMDDGLYGMQTGDRLMFLEGLARIEQRPLLKVWEDANEVDIDYRELERYSRALAAFKQANGLMDYTDMLEEFVSRAGSICPALDVLIVDEAQDLSPVQWRVIQAIASKSARVYVAGDDDQAIYRWAGADVDAFIGLRGKVSVLGQSYRIPATVHAMAERIVKRIGKRTAKQWNPRTERGAVHWYPDPEMVDLSKGTWLLLARNGYLLDSLEEQCRRNGYSFTSVANNPLESPALKAIVTWERLRKGREQARIDVDAMLKWMSLRHAPKKLKDAVRRAPGDKPVTMTDLNHWGLRQNPPIWHVMLDNITESDREYYIAARRRGETLTGVPRIRVSTIHTAKGGEADHVLLLTDMSSRTRQEMDRRLDDEARVWYVAVTRARKALHLIQPRTGNCFEL